MTSSEPTQPINNSDKSTIVIPVVLILSVIVSIGIYFFLTKKTTSTIPETERVMNSDTTTSSSSTSTWKALTQHGYTIQSPQQLEITSTTFTQNIVQDSWTSPDNSYMIIVGSYPENVDPKIPFKATQTNDEQITVAGQQTKKRTGIETFSNKGTLIEVGPISANGKKYLLMYSSFENTASPTTLEIFNTMVKSFSFTK